MRSEGRCSLLKMVSYPELCGKKIGLYSRENRKPLQVSELRKDMVRF